MVLATIVGEAATVTSPNSQTNWGARWPFMYAGEFGSSIRYQQVYGASDFANVGSPMRITDLIFDPYHSGGLSGASISNIQVNLSTTAATPDSLSPVFMSNVGGNDRVVYSGPLFIFVDPAYGFRFHIGLTTPFIYDPAQGNLLLDVRNFQPLPSYPPGYTFMGAVDGANDTVSSVYAFDVSAASASVNATWGLKTTFTVEQIPEPATTALFLAGFLILTVAGGSCRRRR